MSRKVANRPWDDEKFLREKYESENLSTQAITKLIKQKWDIKTYPNSVRRALNKHGIALRTKSQAQSNYLDTNDHPMLGRERTEEEKLNISEGVQRGWDGLNNKQSAQRRANMSERATLKWEWMTDDERKVNIKKMQKANREKSGQGSKNENMVAQLIQDAGFKIAQRTKDYSPRQQFEIDIAIPSEAIAIEWDGAAHFVAIYGDSDLKKTIAKDQRKNKALLSNNWTVIRCRDHSTAHSRAFCRRAVSKIIDIIKSGQRGVVHNIDAE